MATIQEHALLSKEVYNNGGGNPGSGWEVFLDSPATGIGSATGYYGAAYLNRTTGEIVIAAHERECFG